MANTKNMNRHLEGSGEMDYDFAEDILFFKIKNREYDFSLEFQNIVVDIDKEKFITGMQIFDASKFLRMSKINLREIPKWRFDAKIENNLIELRLNYQIKLRNKISEKKEIIINRESPKNFLPQVVRVN